MLYASRMSLGSMPWYGKIFGALIDYQETYGSMPRRPKEGPLFGRGPSLEEKHLAFFTCVFSMLAKLAKADGAISTDEIKVVEQFMRAELSLDPRREKLAKDVFR